MDDSYQDYINRVVPMTLATSIEGQLANLQPSGKFNQGQPIPFPGYTLMTPTAQDESDRNQGFYRHLAAHRQGILDQLPPDLIIPLPEESFHLTIADLIWDGAYQDAMAKNPDFAIALRDCVNKSFHQYRSLVEEAQTIKFQLIGLCLFPRALVACLVPKDEHSYFQIFKLRRAIYQNPQLIALGIEQQYHFTAHISLGYFSEKVQTLKPGDLVPLLGDINDQWVEQEPEILHVDQVELRCFHDMFNFEKPPQSPVLQLK